MESGPYQDSSVDLTKCSKANLIKWKWPHKSDRYPSPKYSKKFRIHPFTRNIFCFSNIDQIFSTSDISFLLYIPKQNIFLPLFSMPLLPRKKSLSKSFEKKLPCLIKISASPKVQYMFGNECFGTLSFEDDKSICL